MTMKNLKYQMAEYQRKINRLRMLRFDLDEQTIVDEVQKIASKYPIRIVTVLSESIELAMSGEPMQWESRITG